MTAVAFDTHKFIKELRGSGLPEGQAEALQRAFSEAIGANLATKVDIERIEHKIESHRQENKGDIERLENKIDSDIKDLKHDIESLRKETKSDNERLEYKIESIEQKMAIMEQRITIRLGSIMVVGIAALAGVIKFL